MKNIIKFLDADGPSLTKSNKGLYYRKLFDFDNRDITSNIVIFPSSIFTISYSFFYGFFFDKKINSIEEFQKKYIIQTDNVILSNMLQFYTKRMFEYG